MQSLGLRHRASSVQGSSKDGTKRNPSREFYMPLHDKPTAAQIVRESREWLQAANTRRPFTPKCPTRSLFNSQLQNSQKNTSSSSRPSSSFKLTAKHFDPSESSKIDVQLTSYECEKMMNNAAYGVLPKPLIGTATSNRKKMFHRLSSFEIGQSSTINEFRVDQSKKPTLSNVSRTNLRRSEKQQNEAFSPSNQLELVGTQTRLITPATMHQTKSSAALQAPQSTTSMTVNGQSYTEKSRRKLSRSRASQVCEDAVSGQRQVKSGKSTDSGPNLPVGDGQSSHSARLIKQNISGYESLTSYQPNSPVGLKQGECEENYVAQRPRIRECPEALDTQTKGTIDEEKVVVIVPSAVEYGKSSQVPTRQSYDSVIESSTRSQSSEVTAAISVSQSPHLSKIDKLLVKLNELTAASAVSEPGCRTDPGGLNSTETNLVRGLHIGQPTAVVEATTLVNSLYTTIQEANLHGRRRWPNRTAVLQAVFNLLDNISPRLHLAVGRLILLVQVNGTNFTNVCKLVYKLAKEKENDTLFLEHADTFELLLDTLQSIETICPLTSDEFQPSGSDHLLENLDALLFLTGSLKFLAISPVTGSSLIGKPNLLSLMLNTHRQVYRRFGEMSTENRMVRITSKTVKLGDRKSIEERLLYILLQISEIFCHLSTITSVRSDLVNSSTMDHVMDCIVGQSRSVQAFHAGSKAVYFNWTRLIARLTEYADVCQRLEDKTDESEAVQTRYAFCSPDNLEIYRPFSVNLLCQALSSVIENVSTSNDLMVRVAYLLGNLTARLESARNALLPDKEAVEQLCSLCESVASHISSNSEANLDEASVDRAVGSEEAGNSTTRSLNFEVLEKLVRVLANAAIGEQAGRLMAASSNCVKLFLDLIESSKIPQPNELLINCLAGLNNITYYLKPSEQPGAEVRQYDIAEGLLQLLEEYSNVHYEVWLGVIRVLGNLTREAGLRDWLFRRGSRPMLDKRGCTTGPQEAVVSTSSGSSGQTTTEQDNVLLHLLVDSLDAAKPELVYSCLGVLINLLTDVDKRAPFRQLGGLFRIVEVLQEFAGRDWQLTGLACKALWNYTESAAESMRNLLGSDIFDELGHLLDELTDDQLIAQIHSTYLLDDPTTGSDGMMLRRAAWRSEFLPVAKELRYRLGYH